MENNYSYWIIVRNNKSGGSVRVSMQGERCSYTFNPGDEMRFADERSALKFMVYAGRDLPVYEGQVGGLRAVKVESGV